MGDYDSTKDTLQHIHTAVMDMRKESMCGYPLSVNDAYVDQQPGDKYHDFFIFAWD